ncbi:FAD-binding oxidoreductase [Deinococcus sp. VB343]|uniref:FAD-binding oxidoreductase n=1 Tax=Deinococcus sp. VB142 TaxID=3112952 RepID=A0AAU6Q6L1_9DEIO
MNANERLTELPRRSVWNGWGDPAKVHGLDERSWGFLTREIGAQPRLLPERPVPLGNLKLPGSRLSQAALTAFREALGEAHVSQERQDLAEHLGGKSYPDLYRARQGDGTHAPDVVVFPADEGEVQAVMDICAAHDLALIPFGGGTSVVGGVEGARGGKRAAVSLDLRRLNRLVHLDPQSEVATFGAGMRGPEAEAALQPYGFTLGHYPQSHQQATIGGYVATRSAGQASTGYGRVDENVLGARVVTPRGVLVAGGRSPASAAGPKLLDLMVGSEGAFGVITEATLRVHRLPSDKRRACWSFSSFHAAAAALRELAQHLGPHLMPDVCRLSDSEETRVTLALAGQAGAALQKYAALRGQKAPCLAIFLWEGNDAASLDWRKTQSERVLARHGGLRLPALVAEKWEQGRFSGPYLRDDLMGHGLFVETLETATTWARLEGTYQAVGQAIAGTLREMGTPAVVQCHVSHVYAAGASLYYTFLSKEAADPLAQWEAVKRAAGQAILDSGATITHHHAVGTAHREELASEVGDLGLGLLKAVKRELDPQGILNPGKLLAEQD